jgi:hypothetical protein
MRSRKSRRLNKNKKNTSKSFLKAKSKNNRPKPATPNPPHHQDKSPRRYKQELDKSDAIEGFARVVHDIIQRCNQLLKPRYQGSPFPGPRLFNSYDLVSESPCLEEIRSFIQSIYDKRQQLHVESGIIALILLNRTKIKIHSQNWMRMVLISLLLANKHCEDVYSVYNAKFIGLIPNLGNLEINILELEFLKFLKYRLHIETETYNQYYAKLQEFFPIEENEDEASEVLISEEEQSLRANEDEMVQTSSSEMEHDEVETSTRNGYGHCSLSKHSHSAWQDYNFALIDSIA